MDGVAVTTKLLHLELCVKTPMIVFDDADLDVVVPVLTKAVTTFSGQFCMTGSRVIAQAGIAGQLRERLSKSLGAVNVGPGDDPASDMGPMIDAENARRVDGLVSAAAEYATVLVPGALADPDTAFYHPSLLEGDDPTPPLVQEEGFGPGATFEGFESEADPL